MWGYLYLFEFKLPLTNRGLRRFAVHTAWFTGYPGDGGLGLGVSFSHAFSAVFSFRILRKRERLRLSRFV